MANEASTPGKRFYTPNEVAGLLGVSSTTVMSRIHQGALPAVRVSDRIYRIPVTTFERFVSTEAEPEFDVRFRRVARVKRLGEPIVGTRELIEA